MINFRLIRHLWLFPAVAEERHFGRAATRLGMSQPPLTEQIQVLEQALQVKLFERSRRGTQLTPAGAAILPEVRKLADFLERLELTVRDAARGQQGVLVIGAVTAAMMDVLPDLIRRLRQRHPRVTVSVKEIDSADAVPGLRAGEIDLALARLDEPPGPDIGTTPLREERLAVALPAEHSLAARRGLKLAQLAEEEFVMFYRRVSPSYFDALIEACRAAGFSPRILYEVDSVVSQIGFVGCGQGIALVPASLRRLAPAGVVVRPLKDPLQIVTASAAWLRTRPHPLVDAVLELAARTPGRSSA